MAETARMSEDDKARMRRLQEEIAGRYFEMAMIMERVLGADGLRQRASAPGARLTMTFKDGGKAGDQGLRSSYLCIEVDGGAWEDPPGICRPGGC